MIAYVLPKFGPVWSTRLRETASLLKLGGEKPCQARRRVAAAGGER